MISLDYWTLLNKQQTLTWIWLWERRLWCRDWRWWWTCREQRGMRPAPAPGTRTRWRYKSSRLLQHYKVNGQKDYDGVSYVHTNIKGQYTEHIMILDVSWGSILVESAFSHPWEDINHGINPVLLISVSEGHDLNTIGEEGAIKELVKQNYLS